MKSSRAQHWTTSVKPYSVSVLLLLASRMVLVLAIYFSSKFVGRSAGEFPDFSARWYRYLLRWDAGWYLKIASEGYSYNGDALMQQPVVFYPLYPLLSKILALATGVTVPAALLVVSNIVIFIAVALFFKLVSDKHGTTAAAYSTAMLCFFPAALFFSAGYTESLALALILSFFLMLQKERFFLAAVFAGLATATRSTGVVLVLPLVIELWRTCSKDWRRFLLIGIPAVAVAISGLSIYMIYLQIRFANAFAFMSNARAWYPETNSRNAFIAALTLQPFRRLADVWTIGPDPNTLSPWFFVAFLLLLIIFRKRLTAAALVYSLGVMLLPYLTLSGGVGFRSFTRYAMLAFPVFVILGNESAKRPWLGLSIAGVFAAMLFMYTVFFAQWYFAG